MYRVIVLGLLLSLWGCSTAQPETSPINPTAQASVASQAELPLQETQPDPDPEYELVENSHVRCEVVDFDTVQAALNYPVDLVANAEGSKLYILNNRCFDYSSRDFDLVPFKRQSCPEGNFPRGYIQELDTQTGKLKILKLKGKPPLSCELSDEIEIDSQGRLYVNAQMNRRLYRIDLEQQSIELLNELNVSQSQPTPFVSPGPDFTSDLKGPAHLYLEKEKLYFALSALMPNLEEKIYRRHENGDVELIYERNSQGEEFPSFSVYQGKISLGGNWLSLPYFNSDLDTESQKLLEITVDDDLQNLNARSLIRRRVDKSGLRYILSTQNYILNYIFKDDEHANFSIFAGTGEPGFKDGPAREAQFNFPMGLTFDQQGNLYIADTGNHAIRKITPEGQVSTLYKEAQSSLAEQ